MKTESNFARTCSRTHKPIGVVENGNHSPLQSSSNSVIGLRTSGSAVRTSTRKTICRPSNQPCALLSAEENKSLFSLLGKERYTLASAVVQLLLSEPPEHNRWLCQCTGIVCFVKDYILRSYFFRIYSLTDGLLWEQEFYRGFQYTVGSPIFHYFEASDSMAAFSFADQNDALAFGHIVITKIESKKVKSKQRKELQKACDPAQSPSNASEQDNNGIDNQHACQASTNITTKVNRSAKSRLTRPSNTEMNWTQSAGTTFDAMNKYSDYSCLIDCGRSDEECFYSTRNGFWQGNDDGTSSGTRPKQPIRTYHSIRDQTQRFRQRKLSKSEISNPISSTFVHMKHIGIDGVRFDSSEMDSVESQETFENFTKMLHMLQPKVSPPTCERKCNDMPKHRRPAPPPPLHQHSSNNSGYKTDSPASSSNGISRNNSTISNKFTDKLKACRSAPAPPQNSVKTTNTVSRQNSGGRPRLPPPSPPRQDPSRQITIASNNAESNNDDRLPPPPPAPPLLPPAFMSSIQTQPQNFKKSDTSIDQSSNDSNKLVNSSQISNKSQPLDRSRLLTDICNPEVRNRLKPVDRSDDSKVKQQCESNGRNHLMDSIRLFDRDRLRSTVATKKQPRKIGSVIDSTFSQQSFNFITTDNVIATSGFDQGPPNMTDIAGNGSGDGGNEGVAPASMMDQIKVELERRRRMMFDDLNDDNSSSEGDCDDQWSDKRATSSADEDEWDSSARPNILTSRDMHSASSSADGTTSGHSVTTF